MIIKKLSDFFVMCFAAFYQPVIASMDHFSFSEPGTGQKVDFYETNITFAGNKIRHFHVPRDCHSIINDVSYGISAPNSSIDRGLWFKIINDCRYVIFLHQNEDIKAAKDFVSNYDFFNAKLEDLPFETKCKGFTSVAECRKNKEGVASDKLKLSLFFPFLQIRDHHGEEVDECHFHEGAFRGNLVLTVDGLRCHYDRRGNGLRLLSVDYGDFNADGYQDALLRMIPLGRGISHMPILLPLTRFEDQTGFSVPDSLSLDFINN